MLNLFCTQLTGKELTACTVPASPRHLTANPAGQCRVGRTSPRSGQQAKGLPVPSQMLRNCVGGKLTELQILFDS